MTEKYLIVGAGSSGLAVAKNFKQRGIPFDCVEREDQLGGNWCYGKPNSSVYRSTHLISSKALTEYTDFPMPEHYAEFPHHRLVFDYLKSYAEHFGLTESQSQNLTGGVQRPVKLGQPNDFKTCSKLIEFSTAVRSMSRLPEGGWQVELETSSGQVEQRTYRGVVIANGHNWDPRFPDFSGEFTGEQFHSCEYKTPDVLVGKQVLVVGAGNSGCDIAVESAQHANRTMISMRRGYHYLPKFYHGKPIDVCGERYLWLRFPIWLRRFMASRVIQAVLGNSEQNRLPKPDHKLFESHPIINSQLAYYSAHGDIDAKPNVQKLCGDRVQFADGTTEPVDVIVYATGFKLSFPFVDREELAWNNGRPELFLNIFHPQHDDLFVVGLLQPDSGQFGLVDYQSQLVAEYLQALDRKNQQAMQFQQEKKLNAMNWQPTGKYVESPRHLVEVEHFSYQRLMRKWIKRLGR